MPPTQLIPSADLAPPGISHLSPRDRARLWAQMVDEGDRLVFEGLLRRHVDEVADGRGLSAPPLRVIDGQGIVQFTFQPPEALLPFQFDVLLVSGDFQKEAVDRAVPWPALPEADAMRVVRPDDLVVIKLLAGRIIDRADAAMLLRENRDAIDFVRLHLEVAQQGIAAEYREAWSDAFPSEPMPRLE